jgi:hypothetical protein
VSNPRRTAISTTAALVASLAVAASSLIAACSEDEARECRVGADCASGACTPEGRCVVSATPPGSSSGEPVTPNEAGTLEDAGADVVLPGCTPNKDGTITADEVPIAAGLKATFRIATDEPISTAGITGGDGKRTWDFAAALASDTSAIVETLPLTSKWYAADFPTATYVSKLSASSNLLGVFKKSAAALDLLGVVSPDEGLSKTRLTYAAPVTVLAFPLSVGKTWSTDTTVSGLASGFVAAYSEKYESEVDAAGKLTTPLGTFDVLRVRVLLTRTVGVLTTKIRTFAYVTECYGTVATVTSGDNEATVDFTQAAELKRIAP